MSTKHCVQCFLGISDVVSFRKTMRSLSKVFLRPNLLQLPENKELVNSLLHDYLAAERAREDYRVQEAILETLLPKTYTLDRLAANCIRFSSRLPPYAIIVRDDDDDLDTISFGGNAYHYNLLPIFGVRNPNTCYRHIFYLDEHSRDVACDTENGTIISSRCLWHRFHREYNIDNTGKVVMINHFRFVERHYKNSPCINNHVDDRDM